MHMNTEQLKLKKWKAHQENMTQSKSSSEIIISLVCVDTTGGKYHKYQRKIHISFSVLCVYTCWALESRAQVCCKYESETST